MKQIELKDYMAVYTERELFITTAVRSSNPT
jgi:hypothetical protein